MTHLVLLAPLLLWAGCTAGTPEPTPGFSPPDATGPDSALADTSVPAVRPDAAIDTGARPGPDAGSDAGADMDGGVLDSGFPDASIADAAVPDAAADAGEPPDPPCRTSSVVECVDGAERVCGPDGRTLVPRPCGDPGCDAAGERCNACVPDAVACDGDRLVTCGSTGDVELAEDCPLGCDATSGPVPSCRRLAPTIVAASYCQPSPRSADFDITSRLSISTDSGCSEVVVQPDGSELCILGLRNVSISTTGVLEVSGPRTLVLVAERNIDIAGTIDVSAQLVLPGPAARTFPDPGAGASAAIGLAGGGGGGHGTAGASGSATSLGGGGAGGAASADIVSPVRGGAPGGASTSGAPGGAGGGAIVLIACGTLRVFGSGLLDAGGGGGIGGLSGAAPTGGSGGGSGGTIHLEAATIEIAPGARIVANGGGGGGGGDADTPGTLGADGTTDATPALGGTGATSGGAGGALVVPQSGAAGTTGGGGGGAAGVVRMLSLDGSALDWTGAVVSPAARLGTVTGG